MAKKYKNLPLHPDTYAQVAMIAEMNGLGERGLGAQVESWVKRDLPACTHEKTPVSVETFPSESTLHGKTSIRRGLYCPTCNRVYQYVDVAAATKAEQKKQAVQA